MMPRPPVRDALPRRLELAATAWPRTGGDRRHSAHVAVGGPSLARVLATLALPAAPGGVTRGAGIALADDGSLRVASAGVLHALTPEAEVLWRAPIVSPARKHLRYHSAPVALAGGATLLTAGADVLLFDRAGALTCRVKMHEPLDDSGPAPALEARGTLLVTRPTGEVVRLLPSARLTLGTYGYDVLPPALYDDGSLGVAGYCGKGYCRVEASGAVRWRSDLRQADTLPALNGLGHAAVASVNDKASAFFSAEGRRLGTFPRVASFAAWDDDAWVALSRSHVSLVASDGTLRWERPFDGELNLRHGGLQPIVDRNGRVHAPTPGGLLILREDGAVEAWVPWAGAPEALAVAGEGRLAAVIAGALVLIA